MAMRRVILAIACLVHAGYASRWQIPSGIANYSKGGASDSPRPRDGAFDLGSVLDASCPQAVLSSLLFAHAPRIHEKLSSAIPAQAHPVHAFGSDAKDRLPAKPQRRRALQMTSASSEPSIGVFELAKKTVRSFSELQVAKAQLPVLRQLSKVKREIKEKREREDARRREASETRRLKLLAEANAQVDVDGDLVISTARSLVELFFSRIQLFFWRKVRRIRSFFQATKLSLMDTPLYARAALELAYEGLIQKHAERLQEDIENKIVEIGTIPDKIQAEAEIKMKGAQVEAQERFDKVAAEIFAMPAELQARADVMIDAWAAKGRTVLGTA